MAMFSKKKILILAILLCVLLISSGFYWYSSVSRKLVVSPEKTFKQYLNIALRQEFIPTEIDLKKGTMNPFTGDFQEVPDLYSSSWRISDENFYAALAYNKGNNDINYFAVSVYYDKKTDINENTALGLVKKYFPISNLDFKCGINKDSVLIQYCETLTIVGKDYKGDFFVLSKTNKNEELKTTSINYFLRPSTSQRYDEENIWGF